MPEQDILHLFMNGGANVAFAAFLWHQNREQQKRADEREARQEAKEKELRDRYDRVIRDLQTREDQMRDEIKKDINDLDKRMTLVEAALKNVQTIVEEIKARFVTVR